MGIFKKSGSKTSKPFYKRVWLWVVAAVLAVSAIGGTGDANDTSYDAPTFDSAIVQEAEDSAISHEDNGQEEMIVIPVINADDTAIEQAPIEEDSYTPEFTQDEYEEPYYNVTENQSSGSSGSASVDAPDHDIAGENLVWVPINGGTKYHTHSGCSNMKDPCQIPQDVALQRGYSACKRCH